MMEMLAAVAKLRVSLCISWGVNAVDMPRHNAGCNGASAQHIAALREEIKTDLLLPLTPPSAIDTVWQRVMTLVQAAQKQGGRPQDATPSSTAKVPVEKEFGADLEFHALRLNSTQDEAMLDPQSGVDEMGTQER